MFVATLVALLGVVCFFVVILGAGVFIGYLLHWMIAALSLEIGILVGVISINFALYFLTSAIKVISERERPQEEEDDNAEENVIHGKSSYFLPELPRYVKKPRKKRR